MSPHHSKETPLKCLLASSTPPASPPAGAVHGKQWRAESLKTSLKWKEFFTASSRQRGRHYWAEREREERRGVEQSLMCSCVYGGGGVGPCNVLFNCSSCTSIIDNQSIQDYIHALQLIAVQPALRFTLAHSSGQDSTLYGEFKHARKLYWTRIGRQCKHNVTQWGKQSGIAWMVRWVHPTYTLLI